jgi:two-component sensor histidine kinase
MTASDFPSISMSACGNLGLQLVHDLTQQLHGSLAIERSGGNLTMIFDADRRGQGTGGHP